MNTLTIKQEITLLRSAVINLIGRDTEGEYRPEFVKSTMTVLSQKATKRFTSAKQFLAGVSKA
jgi:hypothetical protein